MRKRNFAQSHSLLFLSTKLCKSIGSISEIFDADAPHHPRGCVAQAWNVGEVLRVIKEYDLDEVKKKKEGVELSTV